MHHLFKTKNILVAIIAVFMSTFLILGVAQKSYSISIPTCTDKIDSYLQKIDGYNTAIVGYKKDVDILQKDLATFPQKLNSEVNSAVSGISTDVKGEINGISQQITNTINGITVKVNESISQITGTIKWTAFWTTLIQSGLVTAFTSGIIVWRVNQELNKQIKDLNQTIDQLKRSITADVAGIKQEVRSQLNLSPSDDRS